VSSKSSLRSASIRAASSWAIIGQIMVCAREGAVNLAMRGLGTGRPGNK
jgi:hypothetical protein